MKRVWNNTREVYGVSLPLSLSGGRTIGRGSVFLEDREADDLLRKKLVTETPPVRDGQMVTPRDELLSSSTMVAPKNGKPAQTPPPVKEETKIALVSLTRVRLLELCRGRGTTPTGYTRWKKDDLVELLGG